ncbi:DUF2017 domain-containing protein [uncultured Corynebacterium sp.]|uniref:DUF2017 domain-containing protein n=1 Tax=uncultured Corynebacterium sp. TaxID=159447 RepID=UPI0025EDF6E1|nr:DUF2017 domain-containing protein [uncultured Corynebacterium sp.]
MIPWTKKRGLVRGTRYQTRLEPLEREMLGDSAVTVSEALMGRARSAPKDELAEMTGLASGHADAPKDPALARLLPSFFRDGAEEVEGEAAVTRQFTETDIIKAKLLNLRILIDALGPDGSVGVSLAPEQARPWLNAVADIRTYHSAQLDVYRVEHGETSQEVENAANYLDWLGYHQDTLLTAMMGTLDLPDGFDE